MQQPEIPINVRFCGPLHRSGMRVNPNEKTLGAKQRWNIVYRHGPTQSGETAPPTPSAPRESSCHNKS
ncbi:protein of unknown function (plasmid) [Cupriavidus taiwanensis]|uniref:Uncharacterized protein n=1 Tax=Cupriavidus taiwanensis TaxID=164546 RepID=A0A7Z7JCU7_9BURK|nr:protein of unknown function [Cupriavidus taiwanensis]SOZ13128.1 protein of unknown function [Cupriavidus taiwanensis]SOZ41699.1 protein of unknown function [Cupriavidus taiwanensis]SPC21036.1 protein of unknown function [Cupriavidus taiwanensis]SPD55178.1 protein of unknown function [Cupriavidus taiwanensis]